MAHLKEINTTKNSWESVSEKVIAVGAYNDMTMSELAKKID